MITKDVLLLLRHRYQSPIARSKLKFLPFLDKNAYLDAGIFFGFSKSEFINDNTFSLKDKKKRYTGTLTWTLTDYSCVGLSTLVFQRCPTLCFFKLLNETPTQSFIIMTLVVSRIYF